MGEIRVANGPPGAVHRDPDVKSVTSGPGGTVYEVDDDGRARVLACYTRSREQADRIAGALGAMRTRSEADGGEG